MLPVINNLLDTWEGFSNAAVPTAPRWGFASCPSLQLLQQQQHSRQHDRSPDGQPDTSTSYVYCLERDHAFTSNHCVAAMAEQLGISQYTDNLSGTLLAPQLPDAAATTAAIQSIRDQVDGAWSKEAVWRGVGYAKAGDYEQAMECYAKALLLNPRNCDALVARGAARANQKHFDAALADFSAALKLDPDNTNAAKYMQTTQQHARTAAAAAERQRSDVRQQGLQEHGQQRQQQQRDRDASPGFQGQQQHPQQVDTRQQQLDRMPHRHGGSDRQQQLKHARGRQHQQQHERLQDARHKFISRSRSPVRRKRSRSSSGGSSSNSSDKSSSSSRSQSSSEDAGPTAAQPGLKRPSIAEIQQAIQVLRSEHKKHTKKEHSRRESKKKRRKQKQSTHKRHKSKHKHKGRR